MNKPMITKQIKIAQLDCVIATSNDHYQNIDQINQNNHELRYCMIFIHGLGASGQDLLHVTEQMPLNSNKTVFILPNAPIIPVTIADHQKMPAWYDIYGRQNMQRIVDATNIILSTKQIHAIIDYAIDTYRIGVEQIIVAGFSQGGVIAYYAGITYNRAEKGIGGILPLSCYMPDIEIFNSINQTTKSQIENINKTAKSQIDSTFVQSSKEKTKIAFNHLANTSLLVCHGLQDDVVSYSFGLDGYNRIQQLNLNFLKSEFKTYKNNKHNIDIAQIIDISEWIQKI